MSRPLCLAAALSLAACGSLGDYAEARALDLTEVVEIHLFNGDGGGLLLEATPALQLGAVSYDGHAMGWRKRWAGTWQENTHGLGFFLGGRGTAYRNAGWFGPDQDEEEVHGTLPELTGMPDNPLHWMWVRVTAGLVVGVDVEVDLGEALDFAAGLVTWDPSGDDPPPSTTDDGTASAGATDANDASAGDGDATDRDEGGIEIVSPEAPADDAGA